MSAYYNEIDPAAAQWLRNLIEAGHIAPGYVDERSIEDVYPSDLRGFTQCHFFAGIGVWSHALRQAGFADDRPVWTGSCPCQPFSAAGQGAGFADERHLWPAFLHLIEQCRPTAVLGEQVASKDAGPWIDLVHTDLEALGYAFGAIPFPASSVGAPHIRDRLYWVANAHNAGLERRPRVQERADQCATGQGGVAGWMANTQCQRICTCGQGCTAGAPRAVQGIDGQRERVWPDACAGDDGMGARPGPTNGFWRDADWLGCRGGKWRPVEPGTFPLVDGAPARVVRLRAYGNAINAKAAQAFIESVMGVTA